MTRSRLCSLLVIVIATLVMIVAGLSIVYIGSRMAGGLEGYDRFLSSAAPAFLVWRALLYLIAVAIWFGHLRKSVAQRLMQDDDGGREGLARLRRLEYVAAGFVVMVELYNLSSAWEQI